MREEEEEKIEAVFKNPHLTATEIFRRYTLIKAITIPFGGTYSAKFYSVGIVPLVQSVKQEISLPYFSDLLLKITFFGICYTGARYFRASLFGRP